MRLIFFIVALSTIFLEVGCQTKANSAKFDAAYSRGSYIQAADIASPTKKAAGTGQVVRGGGSACAIAGRSLLESGGAVWG